MAHKKAGRLTTLFLVLASVGVFGVSKALEDTPQAEPVATADQDAPVNIQYGYATVLKETDYDKAKLEEILGDAEVIYHKGYAYISLDIDSLNECYRIRNEVINVIDWNPVETPHFRTRPYACTVNGHIITEGAYGKIGNQKVIYVPRHLTA